jgi:hypothetical protein
VAVAAQGQTGGLAVRVYLLFAGVERFLIEFLRAKDDRLLGPPNGGAGGEHGADRDRGFAHREVQPQSLA